MITDHAGAAVGAGGASSACMTVAVFSSGPDRAAGGSCPEHRDRVGGRRGYQDQRPDAVQHEAGNPEVARRCDMPAVRRVRGQRHPRAARTALRAACPRFRRPARVMRRSGHVEGLPRQRRLTPSSAPKGGDVRLGRPSMASTLSDTLLRRHHPPAAPDRRIFAISSHSICAWARIQII